MWQPRPHGRGWHRRGEYVIVQAMTTDAPHPAAGQARPHLRRSVLYVPASNQRAVAKAPSLGADAIVYDLEDAVAPALRPAARASLVEALAATQSAGFERVVRINAIGSEDFEADLESLARGQPDAVLLPKVESVDDLERFAEACQRQGVAAATSLWAMIETTGSLLALEAIALAGKALTPTLDCLVVGTNDIAKETGVFPGEERRYLLPWLMQVILVGRRHGLTVLDGVWNDFADQAGFEREGQQSVRMAFDGKTLIHPSQVAPANDLFSPAAEAVTEARRIVEAFAEPTNQGANVINLGGRMVERLHFEQARLLLARAAAIKARS